MHVPNNAQSTISRWSIAIAMFGGVCNLLSWILENYRDYYLEHYLLYPLTFSLIFVEGVSSVPLLVLFIFRRSIVIVSIYACVLFLIFIWNADYFTHYIFHAHPRKIDEPGLLLLLLGAISAGVVVVWAAIRLAVFIRRTLGAARMS
jgi:hypothetical protein